ncbi:dehydrogenase [Marmoricola endophyticus]|uniref:Dehydrogenase n=1 Tax=Marmoricola endophyticus TaxID=2040280 RepID=A0A917F168_9ACTN|nr:SDR family oxidoreductase [Marmoricola endophyticus]GGF40163.1 dehydrogenase [Marmoricola endophyticus]
MSDQPGTALVTGATAGLGRAFTEQLAERGHDLVLVARNAERLDDVAREVRAAHRVAVEVITADLADRAQLRAVEDRVRDTGRPLTVLVNNAGFGLKERFLDNDVEAETEMLDVLVTAVMRLTHAGLGAMRETGGGRILNVSSVAGFLPRGTYGAAKTYVTQLSRWANAEYAPSGVTVTAVCPGFVRTEFHQRMDVDQGSAPGGMWLDASTVVREALADLDAGKALSVPSVRYRAISAAARIVPMPLLQRLQSLGRG